MKGKWIKKALNDCCDFFSGSGFPERFQGHKSGDYPFIKVSDMSLAGNSIFLTNANNWVSREIATYLSAKIIPAGATAFAKIGAAMLLNRRRITVQGTCFDNNMMAAIPKETIDGKFIYYIFTILDFADFSQVTALPSLNLTALKSYMICLPKIKEDQQHIADILTSCDEMIEQTKKAIAKYRDIKAGMLQDLFTRGVDANGKLRPKPEDAPELYKDSPLGKIPKEWEVKKLNDICQMKAGDGITASSIFSYANYPVYGGNGLRGYTWTFTHDGTYILIGRQGALCGNINIVSGKFYASEHAVVVSTTEGIDPKWLYYFLADMNLNRYSEASAQPGLSVEKIIKLNIIVPIYDEQKIIAHSLSTIDEKLELEKKTLAKYRSIKLGLMKRLLTPPEGAMEA